MSIKAVEPPVPDDGALGIESMTAAETAMAEKKAAQSITTLGNDAFPQVGLIGALGWVLARRTDQRLTFETYMNTHKISDITKELGLSVDDAASPGESEGSTSND